MVELSTREYGQGSPLIILHGLFGFSDNWQTVARTLSEAYLVITPDLRNHGRSPHTESHTYSDMAADVVGLMKKYGMQKASIMGHSMGGKVAMQIALHYPDYVDKLIVVDMDPGQSIDNHRLIFKALFGLDFTKITTRQEAEDFLSNHVEDLGTRQFLLKNITRESDGKFSWKMNLPTLWHHYADILAPVNGEPFREPTLFVRGGRSNYIQDSDLPLIKTLFPDADLVTIPGAGHWVHADKPKELIEVVLDFLSQ